MTTIIQSLALQTCDDMMAVMRYSEEHKEAVHERIVRAAAGALRKSGITGIGIPELMKQAGLTHGAFYAHFENRDALVVEAIHAAVSDTTNGTLAEGKSLAESLRGYVSAGHAEHPERGCVVAALASESARQSKPVRRALAEATRALLRSVDRKLHPNRGSAEVREDALRMSATMVGAIVLARAVDDPALAERILRAARAVPAA